MKRSVSLTLLFLVAWLAGFSPSSLSASASVLTDSLPLGPAPLCLPGIYPSAPGDCLLAGPAAYQTQLAQQKILLPVPPLPSARPDPSLSGTNLRYAEVVTPNAPVYPTIEDAMAKNRKAATRHLNGDFVFISYTHEEVRDGRRFYMIEPGAWMTAGDVSRLGVIPKFQGLTFHHTPYSAFGWVLNYWGPSPLYTQRLPGNRNPVYTTHALNLYDVIPVYAVQNVDGEDWYMIAPDEWLAKKHIALVVPNPNPPQGVTGERWIEVNLYTQTLAVYDQRRLVFATVIASGAEPFWTKPGLFQIYKKQETTPMRGAFSADGTEGYYLEDVPWTMYYDEARALHGAYWRAKMGFAQSHGCVNMTLGDSHWLFLWAKDGEYVYVWDPSGLTPTDPALYGSGGY